MTGSQERNNPVTNRNISPLMPSDQHSKVSSISAAPLNAPSPQTASQTTTMAAIKKLDRHIHSSNNSLHGSSLEPLDASGSQKFTSVIHRQESLFKPLGEGSQMLRPQSNEQPHRTETGINHSVSTHSSINSSSSNSLHL